MPPLRPRQAQALRLPPQSSARRLRDHRPEAHEELPSQEEARGDAEVGLSGPQCHRGQALHERLPGQEGGQA